MVAFVLSDEVQLAVLVISCVLPSVKMPVALNCRFVASAIVCAVGVTIIETRDTVMVRGALALTDPEAAVTTSEPFDIALTSPMLEMEAIVLFESVQVTELLRFCVLPSL